MNKMTQPKRIWLLMPRVDSRFLLKTLVSLNVLLAMYLVFTMSPTMSKNAPCVVVINTSNNNRESTAIKMPINGESPIQEKVNGASAPVGVTENMWDDKSKLLLEGETVTETMVTSRRMSWWTFETRSAYSVINNYIPAEEPAPPESVTLSTQGTFEFLHHAIELCQRWDGHISLAVYAPGSDFNVALQTIYYFRRCRDECIKNRISWHFIYDSNHGPSQENILFPDSLISPDNLSLNCSLSNEQLLLLWPSTFRSEQKLPYPINVARNVARLNSPTKYLLASDIELYPSLHVSTLFQDLLRREASGLLDLVDPRVPHVYVFPIFEVKEGLSAPKTKGQLIEMLKKGDAIFFHKWVCDICQNFPDRNLWASQVPINDTLNVFRSAKRTRKRNSWEPLYIGTNDEPLYDERLSWDGKRDKMSQMYEMCLLNYDLLILDNAFLVHAPGIKHIDERDQKRRLPFITRNNKVYQSIMAKLRAKYGTDNEC